MAQKDDEDFKVIFFRRVELQYPRLKDTYRYNAQAKKSEPCAQNVTNAAWSAGMKMPKAVAKDFFTQMKAHYESCRERQKTRPEFSKVFGMKKDDENGTVTFHAKKKGVTTSGKANNPPTVIDSMMNPLAEHKLEFWSGSIGTVKVRMFPTEDKDGVGGISLLLDTVQVLKAVYGSANLDGFEEEEVESSEPAVDVFAAAAERKAALPKPKVEDEF